VLLQGDSDRVGFAKLHGYTPHLPSNPPPGSVRTAAVFGKRFPISYMAVCTTLAHFDGRHAERLSGTGIPKRMPAAMKGALAAPRNEFFP